VSVGSVTVAPLQQATRTIPIVFVNVPDPVGAGFVESMAHPGGNITGFLNFEYSMSGKWAELLKQIAPNVTRALVCFATPPLRRALDNSALFDQWRNPLGSNSRH
jgi:putative ABC transport system substrate-binding protein